MGKKYTRKQKCAPTDALGSGCGCQANEWHEKQRGGLTWTGGARLVYPSRAFMSDPPSCPIASSLHLSHPHRKQHHRPQHQHGLFERGREVVNVLVTKVEAKVVDVIELARRVADDVRAGVG